MATRCPNRPIAVATLTATVLLPTPPLPPAMATTRGRDLDLGGTAMHTLPARTQVRHRVLEHGEDLVDHADEASEEV